MSAPDSAAGFDPAKFMAFVRGIGHIGAIGIAYCAHGPHWVELELPYHEKLVGMPKTGIIASGPIISLMDVATSLAIWVRLGRFRHQATLDMRVDYLRPATPGKTIFGRGECYATTRNVGFVRGLAHDGDPLDPIAHVAASFMFTED
ncbi:MAG: PaaI family thioesterase [Sphingosinicella sp.]|nr:PaaI family thioesterase [Sphingosinicella sp.]